MNSCLKVYITAVTVLFVTMAFFASPVLADQTSAQNAISSAQSSLQSCYAVAKQAADAGANIDSLMVTFNDASSLLAEAQLAYSNGDYSSASNYAIQSQSMLSGFTLDASSLKQNAVNNDNQNMVIVTLSIIGSLAILCVGIAAWIVLGRKERKNINGSSTV